MLDRLLILLDESYDRQAWHGPNLRGALRGVRAELAAWRPAPDRHNIWEIAVHAAYWKYAVRRRLLGEKRGSFPLKGSNWFERGNDGQAQWAADLALLEDMHRRLRSATAGLDPHSLDDRPKGSKYDISSLLAGIASHDVYHAGQIQLIKRLARERSE